jgi:hypothetical protein
VGQQEEALAEMGCPDLGRAEHVPLRIEPERGQRSHNLVEGAAPADSEEVGDVLEEDQSRASCADNASDLGPEPALVLDTAPPAGAAGRLAGEASRDDIHARKGAGVEVAEVAAPNRSRLQGRVFHPCQEAGRGVGVPLDVTHHTESGEDEP